MIGKKVKLKTERASPGLRHFLSASWFCSTLEGLEPTSHPPGTHTTRPGFQIVFVFFEILQLHLIEIAWCDWDTDIVTTVQSQLNLPFSGRLNQTIKVFEKRTNTIWTQICTQPTTVKWANMVLATRLRKNLQVNGRTLSQGPQFECWQDWVMWSLSCQMQ